MKSSSPIRFVGGKTRLLPILKEYLPAHPRRYFEPFVGGGALFFDYGWRAEESFLNDINFPLINAYRMMGSEITIASIFHHLDPDNTRSFFHEKYEYIKTTFNEYKLAFAEGATNWPDSDKAKFAALFLAINHLCFNGVYRENKKGEFNVPVGKNSKGERRTLDTLDFDALRTAGKKLSNACIACGSFSPWPWSEKPGKGDVLLMDSPYLQEFSSYNKSGFTADDHKVLNAQAFAAAASGATVIVCGSNNAASHEIYGKPTRVVTLSRTVGNFSMSEKNRGKAEEALWIFNATG